MKTICLTGGGTAGHITPNVALLPELKKRNYNIIYIGSEKGLEKDIMRYHNIPFFSIKCDKLRRYFDVKNFVMPFNVIKGVAEATKILSDNKVDVIFSKGGFVAVPVVIAASTLKIPVISHEADITPGLANKIAAPFSKYICCNFKETAESFGNKGIHTGCPIREVLLNGNKEDGYKFLGLTNDKPIIFVTGGSLGSSYINKLVRKNLDAILPYANIVHSCGEGKVDKAINKPGYIQYELIKKDLPDVLAISDLVISRAGANIIFELLALKKLNLLIPLSKKASRGDQILNAKSFEKNNYSAVLLEEDQDANEKLFFEKLNYINDNKEMFYNALNNAKENNAINTICDIIDKTT